MFCFLFILIKKNVSLFLGHDCHDASASFTSIPVIHIKQEKEEYLEKTKEDNFQKRRKNGCFEKKKKEECCRRRKKTKRAEKHDEDYTSESSIQSLSYRTQEIIKHEKSRQTSASFPPLECTDMILKDESVRSPQLFGYFFCEVIIFINVFIVKSENMKIILVKSSKFFFGGFKLFLCS